MGRPITEYISLLRSGRLEKSIRGPVLVWTGPGHSAIDTGEVTDPMRARAFRSAAANLWVHVLEVTDDNDAGLTVGRSRTTDIEIADRSVSRVHAALAATRSGWVATDLGSKNGTRVGVARAVPGEPVALADGTSIQVGNVELVFMLPKSFADYVANLASNQG